MRAIMCKKGAITLARMWVCLVTIFFLPSAVLAGKGTLPISQEQALEIVQNQFEARDVDYYLVELQSGMDVWTFFIDANPTAGWEHECYMATVAKERPLGRPLSTCTAQVYRRSSPTSDNMTLLKSASISRGISSSGIPDVPHYNNIGDAQLAVGKRIWAIIIDGGFNKNSHYVRHWNNCAYIYRVLRRKYGVPKEHISVFMSDGSDSRDDRIVFEKDPRNPNSDTSYYESSPLDLDEDGVADIEFPALKNTIKSVIHSQINNKILPGDQLLVFVTDHGGWKENTDTQWICLWNEEILYDYELAELLRPFSDKGVILNVVLGQCCSGGFIEDLAMTGSVVAAACTGTQNTFGNGIHSYFLYNWTKAISEKNDDGDELFDKGPDYTVNMLDAFNYAKNVIDSSEGSESSPQYQSIPPSLGEQLGFHNIPVIKDPYIKDNTEDVGAEPNTSTSIFWDSPSIWVRNEDDGIETHENPYFGVLHKKCYVYIRVHNRGLMKYEGGQFAHLYWAKASLNFSDKSWKGLEKYNNLPTGGHAGSVIIPPIEPGESAVVKIEWNMGDIILAKIPDDFDRHHFCLLAKIMDSRDDDGFEIGKGYFSPEMSRKQAQKNVTIILREELDLQKLVFVRNGYDSPRKYCIELKPRTQLDERVYQKADIEMELSQPVYDAWIMGGANAYNITQSSVAPRVFKFISPESRIEAVSLDSSQFDKLGMKFDFHTSTLLGESYKLDLIQRDENGAIVGGETFIVQSPKRVLEPFNPDIKGLGGNAFLLSVDNAEVRGVTWRNSQGEIISQTDSVIVKPTVSESRYTVSGITEDGSLAKSEISLDALIGIESATVSNNKIRVRLRSDAAQGDKLVIADAIDATSSYELFVEEGVKEVSVDSSQIRYDVITISYISGDMVVDTIKLSK